MKYKIISYQQENNVFYIEDKDGFRYFVDLWIDGGLEAPEGVLETENGFTNWLKSLVGKDVECEGIKPLYYTTIGKVTINHHLT